ncbi:MAG TPA: hypothetical protein PLN85_01780 [archaeon]|nr:hypothetical protein [archaeon]HRT02708.1 hypothetical protein [Candidatus Diapherotrites archaeon]
MYNVVYTHWTDNGKRLFANFKDEDLFLKLAKLSINSTKNYPTYIYTDFDGREYLSKHLKGVTFILQEYNIPHGFWNLPKLQTYTQQNAPFLHVDLDCYFKEPLEIEDSEIITEGIRIHDLPQKFMRHFGMTFNKPLQIICSGILGGNRVDVFKSLYIMALNYLQGFNIEPVTYQHLITLEEILLTELVKNLQIKKVKTSFNHLQRDARQFSYRIDEVEKDFKEYALK